MRRTEVAPTAPTAVRSRVTTIRPAARTVRVSSPQPSPFPVPVSADLQSALLSELLALPFDAFARCIGTLLSRLGYADVRTAGRANFRGRNQHGGGSGYDLAAALPSTAGSRGRPVVVALKQFGQGMPVYQRQVDELRGACLRTGAAEAVLITTGRLSDSIRHPEALRFAPLAPVRLIDGGELAALLTAQRVGVTSDLKVDRAFFARLAQEGRGNGRGGDGGNTVATAPVPNAQSPEQGIGVTVRVTVSRAFATPADAC